MGVLRRNYHWSNYIANSSYIRAGCNLYDFRIVGEDSFVDIQATPVIIEDGVYIRSGMWMREFTHVHTGTKVIGRGHLHMHQYSILSIDCLVLTSREDENDLHGGFWDNRWIQTSPISKQPRGFSNVVMYPYSVVAARSIVMPGITIGEGAVAGIGSLVNHDLEPWTVYLKGRKVRTRDRSKTIDDYEKAKKQWNGLRENAKRTL